MKVREFLRKHTNVKELCVIRDSGWIVMTVWIDYEDLFRIDNATGNAIVKSDEYGSIPIVNHNGKTIEVDCHYIDI